MTILTFCLPPICIVHPCDSSKARAVRWFKTLGGLRTLATFPPTGCRTQCKVTGRPARLLESIAWGQSARL